MDSAESNTAPIPKVLIYVISHGRVLVHTHADFPEAGVQVPGGTIDVDESPLEAARRELFEETDMMLDAEATFIRSEFFLAPWNGVLYNRHFVAFDCDIHTKEFRHIVSAEAADKGLVFDFFWLDVKTALERLDFSHGAGLEGYRKSPPTFL